MAAVTQVRILVTAVTLFPSFSHNLSLFCIRLLSLPPPSPFFTSGPGLCCVNTNLHGFEPCASVSGIVVSIAAFQAVDPGSIPGQRR